MPERFTQILVVYLINCRVVNVLFPFFLCSKCTISVRRLLGNCFFKLSLNCLQKIILFFFEIFKIISIFKKYLLYLGYDFWKEINVFKKISVCYTSSSDCPEHNGTYINCPVYVQVGILIAFQKLQRWYIGGVNMTQFSCYLYTQGQT